MACQLATKDDFSELKKYLSCDRNPSNLMVLNLLNHLENGRTEGSVFTDDWPTIRTVVVLLKFGSFQKFVVGGEQHGKVLEMITSGGIVDWNSDVSIVGLNSINAKKIIKAALFQSPPVQLNEMVSGNIHVLYGELLDTDRFLPEEFFLQSLKASDLPLVTSKWGYLPPSQVQMYFTRCLEIGEAVGAYKKMENGEQQLVSWAMQYHRGTIAHVYTLENYRKKGLAMNVVHELCKRLKLKGEIPMTEVQGDNKASNRIFKKLGFAMNQQTLTVVGNFEPSCP